MAVFNLSVFTENNTSNNVFGIHTPDINYFDSTLNFLQESRIKYNNCKKVLYKNLLESNNEVEVVNESFKTFFSKVGEIIDRFIKFIKSLFKQFVNNLNRFISSEKYLKSHLGQLSSFKGNFDIKGYEFSFPDGIPRANAYAAFTKDFGKLDFDDMIKKKDKKEQIKYIDKLQKELSGYDYDKFRSTVIGKNYPISKNEYGEELFMLFRNNDKTKATISITSEDVNKSGNRFKNYKTSLDAIKKLKDNLEKDYNIVKKQFKGMISRSEAGDLEGLLLDGNGEYDTDSRSSINTIDKDAINKVDLFIKGKVDQVMNMSEIHSQAFAAKITAIKDQYKQDKTVLYKALSTIIKDGRKRVNSESNEFDKIEYQIFLNESVLEDAKLKRFIGETFLLGTKENSIENIQSLEEGVADSIKNGIMKLLNAIATIWRKFVESVNTLVKSDKPYLEKYKDLILNKEVVSGTFTMYDYPTALKSVLNNATVPQFNFEQMQAHLGSDDDFVKTYFGNFASTYNSEDEQHSNLRAILVQKFRGSDQEIPVPSNKLNMTDIFNFCYNYQSIQQAIQKDIKTVSDGAKNGLKLLDDAVANNANTQPVQNNQQQTNTQQNTTQNNTQSAKPANTQTNNNAGGTPKPTGNNNTKATGESTIYKPLDLRRCYYSPVYESYLIELDFQPNGAPSTNNNPTGVKKTYATPGANTNNTQAPTQPNTNSNAINTAAQGKTDDELDKIRDGINRYLRICNIFLKAKQDVYTEIYKTYMIIIRYQVRSNLKNAGAKDTTGNKDTQSATQYKPGDNNSMVDNVMNGNGNQNTQNK